MKVSKYFSVATNVQLSEMAGCSTVIQYVPLWEPDAKSHCLSCITLSLACI
jgi:hypothetical protein